MYSKNESFAKNLSPKELMYYLIGVVVAYSKEYIWRHIV